MSVQLEQQLTTPFSDHLEPPEDPVATLKDIIAKLPRANLCLAYYLLKFLQSLF